MLCNDKKPAPTCRSERRALGVRPEPDRAESPHFHQPGEARRVGGAAPLGKRGNSLTPPRQNGAGSGGQANENKGKNRGRRDLVADQRRAASIYWSERGKVAAAFERGEIDAGEMTERIDALPGRGVTMCGWTQIAETETELMRQPRPDGHHAYLSGLQMCGLRWVCPVCTAKAAQSDRQDVNDGLAAARGMGLFPVMVTLTTRHRRGEAAADVLAGIIAAEQGLKEVKAWRRLKAVRVGYARVLEWTHGEKNGHHPHFHTILLLRAASEADAVAMAERLHAPYMRQLEAAGRDGKSRAAWQHSFQVQGAAAAESYITKWGSAEELTGALAKAGDGENLTPWQLLRLSRTAPDEADRRRYAAIWWQIIKATKGRAQLYKSEGWRDLVALWRSMQPEAEPEPEPETVLTLGRRDRRGPSLAWQQARERTLAMREAAESAEDLGAAQRAARLALAVGLTDAEIIRAMAQDHDPGPLLE